jgi:coniferyl-aldehyde dehydrogenase
MQALLDSQRNAFIAEGPVSAEARIARINKAIDLIFDNKDQIVSALSQDFGNRSDHQSLMSDIFSTLEALKFNKKHLKQWMKTEKRKVGLPFSLFGSSARVEYQPKGVVGILGTWNFPVNTVFSPLAGILAAGNRAIIKFSEVTPATAALMESLVAQYFDSTEVACVSGGPEAGAAFSSLPFDHLIFTGAGSIGKHVMRAAAEHLTPVTLELGGKSPVIIGNDAELKETATRILSGKALNMGQVCLSPDYVFVPEQHLEAFIEHTTAWVTEMFPTMLNNPDYTSVINARHYQRLLGYLEDAKAHGGDVREINPANENFSQQQGTHKIPLTLVVNPSDDMKVMQEEIFGPIICIKTYRNVEECIHYINANPRPLGLYIFSNDTGLQNTILQNTLSGGVSINDVIVHVSCENLPFGGIGPSGMGNYHGFDGFKTFSHARAIYKQSKINLQKLGGMLPPYGEKCEKTLASMIKK